jgi:superfamily II DNA or RNA helicase
MATTLARIFEDDFGMETLILCPPRLQTMWQREYVDEYGLRARVLPTSLITRELASMKRYRILIIDESHNLRNREGKTYLALKDYLVKNDSLVILLSATPYNKTYLDLSNQLRLFVPEDRDLGIRPEALIKDLGEVEFTRRYQAGSRTLAAFEKSEHADDWRELMRLYMVRRTRTFIQDNYATTDPITGRKYLSYQDIDTGEQKRNYFSKRIPRTLRFEVSSETDQYSYLYNDDVVNIIRNLELPRYGLGQYKDKRAEKEASPAEKEILENLSRAGKRLIGFSRTNLFKRLESSGVVFLQSLERHIVRNAIYLYALENGLPLPIGTQDIVPLDSMDEDLENIISIDEAEDITNDARIDEVPTNNLSQHAERVYQRYQNQYASRFKWIPSRFFQKKLAVHLRDDIDALSYILNQCGDWNAIEDKKLNLLVDLLTKSHPNEKILIFTQFADTVTYLERELKKRGVKQLAGVVGSASNPTEYAYRFSPYSNRKKLKASVSLENELRILIATDVLSEGQNLQDGHIVVNYDIAWAIIRLIQRAGRVDRIGQQSKEIYCYSFLPADGVERIIRLRERIKTRLKENAEVVGTDEQFFEDEDRSEILNLYNEHAEILNDDGDSEVDLASYALEIWNKAIANDSSLKSIIERMPMVSYATREHIPNPEQPEGALVYLRTHENNDLLAWVDTTGKIISESQYAILNAARCTPDEPALERSESHHEAVEKGVQAIIEAQKQSPLGGQLGRPSGARFKTYERLKAFADAESKKMFAKDFEARGLFKAVEEILRYPLRPTATDTLNRQLKAGISDEALAELVMNLREEDRLCIISDKDDEIRDPRIICSMGLRRV